jgi:hypothetical protein
MKIKLLINRAAGNGGFASAGATNKLSATAISFNSSSGRLKAHGLLKSFVLLFSYQL